MVMVDCMYVFWRGLACWLDQGFKRSAGGRVARLPDKGHLAFKHGQVGAAYGPPGG